MWTKVQLNGEVNPLDQSMKFLSVFLNVVVNKKEKKGVLSPPGTMTFVHMQIKKRIKLTPNIRSTGNIGCKFFLFDVLEDMAVDFLLWSSQIHK